MGVGAIGSMNVSGYIYNPNRVTSKSLNKIQRISDDVLDGKLDVKNEVSQENENPLKVGETQSFPAVLEEQMYMGMNKAAMLFGF
jgi:hypothetical protein